MRLAAVETGHRPAERAELEEIRKARGGVVDVQKTFRYRPELFGLPFRRTLHKVLRGPSGWSPGERELFATFVSAQNQCPF